MDVSPLIAARTLVVLLIAHVPACAQVIRTEDAITISFPKKGLSFDQALALMGKTTGRVPHYQQNCVPPRIRLRIPKPKVVPENRIWEFWQDLLKRYGFAIVPLGATGQFIMVEPIHSGWHRRPRIPTLEVSKLMDGEGDSLVACHLDLANRPAKVAERHLSKALDAATAEATCWSISNRHLSIMGQASTLRPLIRMVLEWKGRPPATPFPRLEVLQSGWVDPHAMVPVVRYLIAWHATDSLQPSIMVVGSCLLIHGPTQTLRVAGTIRDLYDRLNAGVDDSVIAKTFLLTYVPPHQIKTAIRQLAHSRSCGALRVETNSRQWSVTVTAPPTFMPLVTNLIRKRDQ